MAWSSHLPSKLEKEAHLNGTETGELHHENGHTLLPSDTGHQSLWKQGTHRAIDAGDVIVMQRCPTGVGVAIGGAPQIRVGRYDAPVHEAERQDMSYTCQPTDIPHVSPDPMLRLRQRLWRSSGGASAWGPGMTGLHSSPMEWDTTALQDSDKNQ